MRASVADRLSNYGAWTYRGAWVLEVAASLIGLSTGILLGYQAFSSSETATSMDLILASAPFFMVALAELTKIPAATVLFSARWIWKPVVLLFLVALAGITFETVFMGLERAATLRQLRYETLRQEIDAKRLQLDGLRTAQDSANATDLVADARAQLDSILTQANAEKAAIQEEIGQLDKQLAVQVTLSPAAVQTGERLANKKQERDNLLSSQAKAIEVAVAQFESQRDSFVKRIEIYSSSGDLEAAKKVQAQLDALANPRGGIQRDFAPKIALVEDQIGELEGQFDAALASSEPMSEAERAVIEDRRQRALDRLEQVSSSYNSQLDAARERLALAQQAEAGKDTTKAANQQAQDELVAEIARLEGERIPMAREDQIRRIAGRFFGLKPEDVSEEQADVVSVIWFGSLAALAALAGPITAMIALGLQRIAESYGARKKRGLLASIRRLISAWRWHRVRTVKVPVEVKVEVEREVEKRVEVPVETVIKEILYVPILTDDPDAIVAGMRANLPPEVVEKIQVATKRPRRASKAQHVAP